MKVCPHCQATFEALWATCPYDGEDLEEQQADPLIGTVFADQYEIISILGAGGMSVVYKARHRMMGRTVALKLLHGHADPVAVERFKQEAQAASSLNHPNIISIYDFGMIGAQAYLVMDCLDGENLFEVLTRERRLSVNRGLDIFRQTCSGLAHAHKNGIVHRDLKPSNLCLIKGEDGKEIVKIVDFGIAKLLGRDGKIDRQLTQTGEIFGSPMYMSPEQCLAQPLDIRSDIYSLGCVMYEAFTGVPPLLGETAYDTMTMHVGTTPAEFAKAAPDAKIDKNIESIVFRCLEKKPEERYQTATEIVTDLPTVHPDSGSLKVKAVQHPTKQRREMRFLRYGFWTLFFFVAGVFSYMSLDHGPDNDKGTVLQKTIWNSQTTIAQTLMNWQDWMPAQFVLGATESTARKSFSNKGRLITALNLERELYKRARMFEELENANKKLVDVQQQILIDSYASTMKDIDDLSNTSSMSAINVNKIMAPIVFAAIANVARNLAGNSLDKHEESLLTHAKEVYTKLLGPQDLLVADIDMLLGECYLEQQRTPLVRPLLAEALQIYDKSAPADKRTILARMKLGQFDRDENQFDLAKVELEQALDDAKKNFSNDKYLMFRCISSYADYLGQIGEKTKSEEMFVEAQQYMTPDSVQD